MKIRLHRGSLTESLSTLVTIQPTHAAIKAFLRTKYPELPAVVEVLPYEFDPRIGWDTHIVLYGGRPVAFTDGAVLKWTKGDAQEAQREGWDVFRVNRTENTHEIQRCDERGIFDSDGDALMHVYDRALQGSTFHRKAIEFTLATTKEPQMSDDQQIEDKIVAQGLTAPRISLADLDTKIAEAHYWVPPGTTMTICVLTLVNGFNVIGTSACVSPENFNVEIGREIAYKNARNEIWQLEGYLLAERLQYASAPVEDMKDLGASGAFANEVRDGHE